MFEIKYTLLYCTGSSMVICWLVLYYYIYGGKVGTVSAPRVAMATLDHIVMCIPVKENCVAGEPSDCS